MDKITENPLQRFQDAGKVIILDGGLATTLEDRGWHLDDKLWSARVLLDDPTAIAQVHRDFLETGADVITTATYQATLEGLGDRGLDPVQARSLLERAVAMARAARDDFWSLAGNRTGRLRPLVAASVGPYGAYLADGSEYSGQYGRDQEQLRAFHRERWDILAGAGADLLACETLPSLAETRALLDLLESTPGTWAWFSFSCGNGSHLWDGTPFAQAVALCDAAETVAAIGINCTDPAFIGPLLEIGRANTDKPLIVYPNSGETYDPVAKSWSAPDSLRSLAELAPRWRDLGAAGIGGCCRCGPQVIREIRRDLLP